jgi:hypothetical protein
MTDAAAICAVAHELVRKLQRHSFSFDMARIPTNGLYVLFERGENAHGGSRVVRVGTHTGQGQLRSRLTQHFLRENKDRSIFRKNIGRCLLAREADPYADTWEYDLTTSKARAAPPMGYDPGRQQAIEAAVSAYMHEAFTFVVLPVEQNADRLRLESGLVSLVSRCSMCRPSPHWLGLHSPREKIRKSGLWQVNELYKVPLSEREVRDLLAVHV